jgi:hypothetical protein
VLAFVDATTSHQTPSPTCPVCSPAFYSNHHSQTTCCAAPSSLHRLHRTTPICPGRINPALQSCCLASMAPQAQPALTPSFNPSRRKDAPVVAATLVLTLTPLCINSPSPCSVPP